MIHWIGVVRRSLQTTVLLGLLLTLASCGGGGDDTMRKRVARLEVTPTSLVLTASEPTRLLRVRAFAEDGTEIPGAPISYTSSQPQAVQVDAQGRVSALVAVGSALIEIASGDVVAAAVPAVAATPRSGVVLLNDDEIIGDPVLVTATQSMVGSQLSITVRKDPVPSVGSMLLASESAAVAGRVVEVVRTESGASSVIFEVVRLDELFDELKIETVLTPDQVRRLVAAPVQQTRPRALASTRATAEAEIPIVKFGPLECSTDLGAALLDVTLSASIEDEISIRFSAGVAAGRQEPLVMAAGYSYGGATEFAARLGQAKGGLSCNLPLFTVPVPVPAFLQLLLQPSIPIGIGIRAGIDASTNAEIIAKCSLNGRVSFGIGYDEQWKPLDLNGGNVEGECSYTPGYNPDASNIRLGWNGLAGIRVGLAVDSVIAKLNGSPPLSLLDGRAGLLIEDERSLPMSAALDTNFTPGYRFSAVTEVSTAADLEEWLQSWTPENLSSLIATDFTLSRSLILGRSPTITAVTVDKSAFSTGEQVSFSVTLDPLTSNFPSLFGVYNIQEIRIYLIDQSTGGTELIATQPAADGQLDFQFQWVASRSGLASLNGARTFHAFAVPRIWNLRRDAMPLELGAAISKEADIHPPSAIAVQGSSIQFDIFVDGTRKADGIVWTATGGSITNEGLFRAGEVAGHFQVTATDTVTGASSTSLITITAQPLGFFLTGTVVSEEGRPISNARIDLAVDGVLITTASESDGLYRLELTATQYSRLPPSFVIGASNAPLYHPAASEVKRSDGDFVRKDFVLASVALNPNILSIELVPDVHHLGDSNFSGAQNSQFQYPNAEGAGFSKQFNVSAEQRRNAGAQLRLIAKGVQCPNSVRINGTEVARLEDSPSDGSYASYDFAFDPAILAEGDENTFTVAAASCDFGDLDDFEFANAQIFFK